MDIILSACDERSDIFVISGDAGLGVFDKFQIDHPQKFINLGIAEQNAASMAAGMALTGYKVCYYNIIPFLLYRCYEQIRNDICYQNLPVVLIGTGAGLTYAPGGMTHYSVEDLGIARTLPNLRVFSPIDPVEAQLAARFALNADEPVYIRVAKRGEPVLSNTNHGDITKPQILRSGDRNALIFHGSIAADVVAAYQELLPLNIAPRLISMAQVQPLDIDALAGVLDGIENVVCVEEHFEQCGLGAALALMHARCRPSWKFTTLAIPSKFIHRVGSCENLRQHFKIDKDAIVSCVKSLVKYSS